jgi:aminopeptidase N
MQMNGSPSQGLNLHEGGHIYSYGLLGNNEWQSGWMDEGLTSYQTAWATGDTRSDYAAGNPPTIGPAPVDSARRRAQAALEATSIAQARLVTSGRMQPIGTRGDAFSSSAIYSGAVYTRASIMYGALRDVIGDSAFSAFLRDYYARWAYRHVDEAAMRASAERVSRRDLGWFFEQWVHRAGNVDYALRDVRSERSGRGWVTRATLVRTGDYRHPMPVGVRTSAGWTVVRGDALRDRQSVVIRSTERPEQVRLDPLETTEAVTRRFYAFPRASAGAGQPRPGG